MVKLRSRSTGSFAQAVTLIEIVVTVSIISLLLALVSPELSRAQRASRSSTCLSNLRQLAAACTAYSTVDENSLILPAHPISDVDTRHQDGNYDWGGNTGVSAGWGGTYGPNGPRTAPTRPLNRQLFGNGESPRDYGVFRCPDDTGPPDRWPTENWWYNPDFADRPMFLSVGTSYRGNALRHHEWESPGRAKPPFLLIGVFLRPVSRVPSAGETVLLWEAGGGVVREGKYPEAYRYGIRVDGAWHGQPLVYNVGYVDGHAESVLFAEAFPRGAWRSDPDGYAYQVRYGRTRWDCRPEPLLPDKPIEEPTP